MNAVAPSRQTKYCQAIETILAGRGHATNAELLRELRESFPGLSATTVHRATARLAGRGQIALAPPAPDGSLRYDHVTKPHDHFMCSACGALRDTDVMHDITPLLEARIGNCRISGRLTIMGTCQQCMKGELA